MKWCYSTDVLKSVPLKIQSLAPIPTRVTTYKLRQNVQKQPLLIILRQRSEGTFQDKNNG